MNAPQQVRLVQLNDVRLVGRLTRDPEVRYTAKGQAVARLDLAVNRRYKGTDGQWKDDTSFVPITVWREAAERCREKLKKGSPIYVEGRLRSTSWETKEGQKRTGLEVEAYRLQFLARETVGGGDSAEPDSAAPDFGSDNSAGEAVGAAASESASSGSVDDIPF